MKHLLIIITLLIGQKCIAQDTLAILGEWIPGTLITSTSDYTLSINDSTGRIAYRDSTGWHYEDAAKVIEALLKMNNDNYDKYIEQQKQTEKYEALIRKMVKRISEYEIYTPQ